MDNIMLSETEQKLKHIKLLLLDVDGVLTDGSIIYNDNGVETKIFNVKDGLGIILLMNAGIKVGIITGRRSAALHHRCKNLGIDLIFDGISDKRICLEKIKEQTGISETKEIAFVGDDLPDIPIMKRVGLAVAVNNAHQEVLNIADMITDSKGGRGAVREVCEAILHAQGLWEKATENFQD